MQSELTNGNDSFLRMMASATQKRQVRLGMDFLDDHLWYGLEIGGKTCFVRSDRRAFELGELPAQYSAIEGALQGMPMSPAGIQHYLEGREVDGGQLIRELADYFARHAKFEHEELPTVLALWVVAGYAHMAFPIFPYLSVTSAQRGCGKSRVLELLAEVAFRAKPIIINPTPAVLFRSLHDSAQVMLVDEFEDATDDAKKAMITVLNSGFSNGDDVPRCVGDEHNIKHFRTFSPKAFAGLSRIPETLQNRSIPILMMPKTSADNILPFFAMDYEEWALAWRDEAATWALCNASALAKAARKRQDLAVPAYLEDREADYMATLFATAKIAEHGTDTLRSYCQKLALTRQNRAGEGQATRAAEALSEWYQTNPGVGRMFLTEAATMLYECEALAEQSERDAGALLRKMGLQVVQIRIGDVTGKGVFLTREAIEKLALHFARPSLAQAA